MFRLKYLAIIRPEPQEYRRGIVATAILGIKSLPLQTKNRYNMKDKKM